MHAGTSRVHGILSGYDKVRNLSDVLLRWCIITAKIKG